MEAEAQLVRFADDARFPADVCDDYCVPARQADPALAARVATLEQAVTNNDANEAAATGSASSAIPADVRKRVMQEARSLLSTPHDCRVKAPVTQLGAQLR